MEFRVLGPLEVLVDGVPARLGGPRPRAVLGTLLTHAGRAVSVQRLIDQVWDEDPPPTAVAALQMHISALRRVLRDRLVTTTSGYRVDVAEEEIDAHRFESALRDVGPLLTQRPAQAAADLSSALALWHGEPYGGVAAGSDVAAARVTLSELRLSALEDKLEVELGLGRHAQAAPELSGLVAEYPGRPRLAGLYLLALYRCGRINDAQAAYDMLLQRLADEFGTEPAAAVTALARAISRRDPTLDPPTAIPTPPSRFIGRRGELERLADRLGRSRLLTLTGPGGCGKTRLALELARDTVIDHPDGVFVIELAPLPPGGAVAERLAAELSVRPRPGLSPAQAVADQLRGMRALIVLDNCEHVIDGSAALAARLLGRCAGLRILATSREPLGIDGEQVWPLTGLRVPAEEDEAAVAVHSEAIRLLSDRGAAALGGFAVTARNAAAAGRLCRLLDGLPLAIELAAAQLRTMSLPELATHIGQRLEHRLTLADRRSRTAPDRHHTMHAAIDWSYQLLAPEEQALFRRLSVFAGGFRQEAAETVAGETTSDMHATLDVLARLVDQSVLTADRGRDGVRFVMLELVRQYAAERLAEAGETEDIRDRHAAWCVTLAEGAAQFGGDDHAELVRRLDLEEGNLRAALEWCLGEGADPMRALEISSPLWWYWWTRGLMSEGRGWLRRALAATDPTPTRLRGSALRAAAALTRNSGDYAEARDLGEQCLAVYQALSERTGLISALGGLCVTAIALQDFDAALRYGRESCRLAEEAGDRLRYGSALNNIGLALRCLGRIEEAGETFGAAMENCQAIGDRRGEAATLSNLGRIARLSGNQKQARCQYTQSLALYRDLDLAEGMLDMLEALASLEAEQGHATEALRLLTVCERERVRLGAPLFVQDEIADRDQTLAKAHAALGQRATAVTAEARDVPLETVVDETLAADRSRSENRSEG
ncbi:MAG TPA: BTAD domain-containing putative transcriptional regulator [Actinocrinis sp.]|uniref:BTAD domain-containing putative transcriptional regulator n=1 Tax=Actinocrinis sp. TaxID=1920516 RepID=UPI002DDD0BCE|nr:BTAD domain-containing putative transcriptional regulator [Actinocrinis sp.]HEV3169221.1 BTAD domain-containing putative transcriptional regulator [Actinocrinis sp.]